MKNLDNKEKEQFHLFKSYKKLFARFAKYEYRVSNADDNKTLLGYITSMENIRENVLVYGLHQKGISDTKSSFNRAVAAFENPLVEYMDNTLYHLKKKYDVQLHIASLTLL